MLFAELRLSFVLINSLVDLINFLFIKQKEFNLSTGINWTDTSLNILPNAKLMHDLDICQSCANEFREYHNKLMS